MWRLTMWEPKGLEIDVTYSAGLATEVSFVFPGMDRLKHRTGELSKWVGFDVTTPQCIKRHNVDVSVGANSLDLTWTKSPCKR